MSRQGERMEKAMDRCTKETVKEISSGLFKQQRDEARHQCKAERAGKGDKRFLERWERVEPPR